MIVGNKTDLLEDESGRPVKSEDGMKLAEVMAYLNIRCSSHVIHAFLCSKSISWFCPCS